MASDLELLSAWRNGDDEAGETLFERHFQRVYRFFRTKLHGDVDDLVQATFMAWADARDRFHEGSNPRAYLFAVARTLLHGHLREKYRDAGAIDFNESSMADLASSPSRVVARRQDHRLLLEALRAIPLDYQIAIELSYWEQMQGPEIALVLGIGESTVRARIRRARMLLAERMNELAESSAPLDSTLDNLDRWAGSLRDYLDAEARA